MSDKTMFICFLVWMVVVNSALMYDMHKNAAPLTKQEGNKCICPAPPTNTNGIQFSPRSFTEA